MREEAAREEKDPLLLLLLELLTLAPLLSDSSHPIHSRKLEKKARGATTRLGEIGSGPGQKKSRTGQVHPVRLGGGHDARRRQ